MQKSPRKLYQSEDNKITPVQEYEVKKAFELANVFLRRLQRDVYCGMVSLECEFALASHQAPFAERKQLAYRPIQSGEIWGHACVPQNSSGIGTQNAKLSHTACGSRQHKSNFS